MMMNNHDEDQAPAEESVEDFADDQELDFEPEDELGTIGSAKAKLAKLKEELSQMRMEIS